MKPGGGLLREIADEAVVKAVTLRKITDKAGVEAMPVAQGLGVEGETSLDAGAAVIGVRHEDPKFRVRCTYALDWSWSRAPLLCSFFAP